MVAKTSISLTEQQLAFAREQVEAGSYASVSAVIQQALERMRKEAEERALEREMLRELIERRRKGPHISMDEFASRVDDMLARKRRERGL